MTKLPVLTSSEIIKIIKHKGFQLDHSTGSHFIFYHDISKRRVVAPFHNSDLPKGTPLSIIKQAGINRDEL